MPSSRHLGRVMTLQALFAFEFVTAVSEKERDPEAILEYVSREFADASEETVAFAFKLLNGVLANKKEIRARVEQFAPEWPFDKIAPIDRGILEIAVFEMAHSKEVPAVVAIDEAIELAKSFGNESSPKFVNGVLNAIFQHIKPASES